MRDEVLGYRVYQPVHNWNMTVVAERGWPPPPKKPNMELSDAEMQQYELRYSSYKVGGWGGRDRAACVWGPCACKGEGVAGSG